MIRNREEIMKSGYAAPVLRMAQVAVSCSIMIVSGDGDIDDLEDGVDYGDGME